MERLLAVWIDELSQERADGSALRTFATIVEALVGVSPFIDPIRLGLLVLPLRGPSRFFGGDAAVLDAVRTTVGDIAGVRPRLGVAEGLFCAELAARQEVVVAAGETTAFRRAQLLDVLGSDDLATTGRRLGFATVGAFADLSPGHVAERFSDSVRVLHRVARGELSELPSQRDRRLASQLRRTQGATERVDEQLGFFGQRTAGDDRARAAAHRVRQRLGAEGVLIAEIHGGRSPEECAALVPWGAPGEKREGEAPWPGQLGAPAPTTSFQHPVAIDLRDEHDRPLRLSARGHLSGEPCVLVLDRGVRRRIAWSAGPWPFVERWWSTARRRAYVQLLLEGGEAMLVTTEHGRWWLTGIYD